MKKYLRPFICSCMFSLLLLVGFNTTAHAQTTAILAKDSGGILYQYSYQNLVSSLMGDDNGVLFNDFKSKVVIAYKDDKTGYVDFGYLVGLYMDSDKKSFSLNAVTESVRSENTISVTSQILSRTVGTDGKFNDTVLSPGDTDLEVIDIS